MIDCVHSPGPPLRFSPGWQNSWAFGPKSLSDASRIPFRLSPEQSTRQVLQQLAPIHPQFVPTSMLLLEQQFSSSSVAMRKFHALD
jgi:hypothetical protein